MHQQISHISRYRNSKPGMAKVAPGACCGIRLHETRPDHLLSAYDPAYVARKARSARRRCAEEARPASLHFTEGDPADPAVLCLHSLGQRAGVALPKPLPGIFLIAVDRQGHGASTAYPAQSPVTAPRKFSDDLGEYVELLDSLGVDKFFVTGSSMGGCWTLAIAAALPERVLACAPISALTDPRHPSVPKAQRGKLCGDAGTMTLSIGDSGCAGGLMRSMTNPYFKAKDPSKDPGFAKKYISYFKYGDATGKKHGPFEAMDSNPFFVSALLDAYLHGVNSDHCGCVELVRIFGKQGQSDESPPVAAFTALAKSLC